MAWLVAHSTVPLHLVDAQGNGRLRRVVVEADNTTASSSNGETVVSEPRRSRGAFGRDRYLLDSDDVQKAPST